MGDQEDGEAAGFFDDAEGGASGGSDGEED